MLVQVDASGPPEPGRPRSLRHGMHHWAGATLAAGTRPVDPGTVCCAGRRGSWLLISHAPPRIAGQRLEQAARKARFEQQSGWVPILLAERTCLLYTSPSPRDGLLSR